MRSDPGRQGHVTGRTRLRHGFLHCQIAFADGSTNYVPEDQLDAIPPEPEDPIDLLRAGRLGRAIDLRRALTHVRLTGRLANVIYSMDTTGTDFYAYQFKPVLKLLNSASNGILIADEVGLGKTIEAGLIWTELGSRFDFRRLLVLCPAVLREKWRKELRNRFGVDAEILGASDVLDRLRRSREQGGGGQFAIVCSLQGLRPRRGWDVEEGTGDDVSASALARFLQGHQHEEPLIDLVVIDEAHYLRNPESMTSRLGRLVRDVSNYVVLLSATPVHLKSGDLFQLLNLVDSETFNQPQSFDEILEANRPLVRAREDVLARRATRSSLVAALENARSHRLLEGNRQLASLIEERPTDEDLRREATVSQLAYRLDVANLLGHVVTRTRRRDVTEWRVHRDVTPEAVELNDVERRFYEAVTDVVREYCARASAHEGFLLVTPQRQMSSCMAAALRHWQERGRSLLEDEVFEDLGLDDDCLGELEEPGPLVQELIRRVGDIGDFDELSRNDSKYARLREIFRHFFQDRPREKVVLFSTFRATLQYLDERLRSDGVRCFLLRGGDPGKDAVIRDFLADPGPAVLLSSEVGSEGIDLQRASFLVNYDLPWNPMRVEQRIGRIDRLGQLAERVHIWNLFCRDTIDDRIYERLFLRLGIFQSSLGALEPVLGEHIRQLTMELLRSDFTPKQEEDRIAQTALALENIRREEERLESEAAHLVAYGDYILNQVVAARELNRRIEGADIYSYVRDFLHEQYPGSVLRQRGEDPMDLDLFLPVAARHDLDGYVKSHRLQGRTSLTRNDVDWIPCRFENSVLPGEDSRVETISQWHPVTRFVGQRMRDLDLRLHPAVAVTLKKGPKHGGLEPGVYVASIQRWSLSGIQKLERLHYAVAALHGGQEALSDEVAERLVVDAARGGADWLGAKGQIDLTAACHVANEVCFARSDAAFDEYVKELRAQNEDRADVQERTRTRHFDGQLQRLEETRALHLSRGRNALARATEGRMQALRNRFERRKLEIAEGRQLTARKDEICVALVRLEE